MTLRQLCRANVLERNRAKGRAAPWAAALIGLLGMVLTGCGQQQPSPTPSAPRPPLANRPPVASKQDAEQPIEPVTTSAGGRRLPLYELKIAPKDLQALDRNVRSDAKHPATFTADGEVYEQVKVRYRGAFARSWPKKPLKVFFNDNKPFQGQSRVNLNSGWRDPAYIRETLAYEIYAACGAPASKSRMVRVDLNGQFRGLYVEVEQPDKAFLKRLNLKGASIYKASSRSNNADERDLGAEAAYRGHYEKETQKDESYADLQQFCQELARTQDVLDFFTRHVDLKRYIDFLAATTLTQNWDGYNKNHFIVYDGKGSRKWFAVPWDLDRTLGDYWDWSFSKADLPILLGTRQMPGVTGWNRMADRFFSHPTLRAQFLARLEELLEKEFTTGKLFPIVDRMEAEISSEAARDRQRWGGPSDLRSGVAELKSFIERRRAYLVREIPKLRRDTR